MAVSYFLVRVSLPCVDFSFPIMRLCGMFMSLISNLSTYFNFNCSLLLWRIISQCSQSHIFDKLQLKVVSLNICILTLCHKFAISDHQFFIGTIRHTKRQYGSTKFKKVLLLFFDRPAQLMFIEWFRLVVVVVLMTVTVIIIILLICIFTAVIAITVSTMYYYEYFYCF